LQVKQVWLKIKVTWRGKLARRLNSMKKNRLNVQVKESEHEAEKAVEFAHLQKGVSRGEYAA
jgi:hypothetical protein